MTITALQSAKNSSTTNNTTIAATVPSNGYAIGDLVVGHTFCSSNAVTLTSITDTGGNTWTVRGPFDSASAFRMWTFECVLTVALASGNTVTATVSANNARKGIQIVGVNVSGGSWVSPFDKTNNGGANSNAPDSGNTATLAQADEIAFGVIGWRDSSQHTGDMTWEVSWTDLTEVESGSGTTWRYGQGGYKIVAATTAIKASGAFGTGTNWLAIIQTYAPTAAAGPPLQALVIT